VQQLAIK